MTLGFLQSFFNAIKISHDEFHGNNFTVSIWINRAIYVNNIFIFKTTNDMDNCIYLSNSPTR